MILTLPQIKSIIKDNPARKIVQKGVDYSKKLRRHIYGEGMEAHLQAMKFEDYEKDKMRELRAKYTRNNKDVFARLARPIDKVFSARGGSVYYNLSDTQDKQARILSQNVSNGYSARKWIEKFWKPHMLDDPFGIIFMEILPQTDAVLAKQQGRSFVYPSYKSINTIFDYLTTGNRFEYIVFKLSSEDKKHAGLDEASTVYRVVDDAFDYYVRMEQDEAMIITNLTLVNFFGEVPAITNSDLVSAEHDRCFLSLYDDIIELAEEFLIDGSVKRIHKFLHGFPKYSEFADDCTECNATKFVNGEKCKACLGTGKKIMTKVSDAKLLTWPGKDEPMILPNQVGGYISPDKTYFEISTTELQGLEDAMNVTLWGTQSKLKSQGPAITMGAPAQTATEIMDETKPMSDRLHPISEMAETRHKFIMDMVIRLNLGLYSYPGSSVNYGRRYMLEGPDVIWEKYSKARNAGAPQNVLDTLLNEYYEANYQSDPVGLAIAKKLMYVEPFVHFTASVLKGLNPDPKDYTAKLYFSEWLATVNESVILASTSEELKTLLADYTATKKLLPEVKEPIAA